MIHRSGTLTARAVAEGIGGSLCGPGEVVLRQVRSLEAAGPDALSLCNSPRWAARLAVTQAGAVIVPEALRETPGPATRIVVADPALALTAAVKLLHPENSGPRVIDATARIGEGTRFGDTPRIGAYAVIGAGVRIGHRAQIAAHVVIEDGVVIGDDVRLDAHVSVHNGSVLGNRVWCKASSVIGGAGFGFLTDAGGHHRTPQIGGCLLEDDVDIGSCSTVDRGSLDDTIIGQGTKLDNHVQIGHNVHIGKHCLLMSGAGIAGSAHIGDRVIIAGQAAIVGHLTIGNDVRIGGKAGVISSLPDGADVWGVPARPHRESLRAIAALYQLAPHYRALVALAGKHHDA